MSVKAKILDRRNDGKNECFLSKMTIEDYVNALPSAYQEYDVQREIVSNVYLDHLVETVLNRNHIPPIVLVVDSNEYNLEGDYLYLNKFKILDGLQRSYRLQAIQKTIDFCCTNLDPAEDYLSWPRFKFSRHFSSELVKINSNTDVLRSIVYFFQKEGEVALKETIANNTQWFEIWTGLTPEEEVRKMLMLNAGHKPVKARHQLELLFLNLLPVLRLETSDSFKIVREKEISATQFSKKRTIGDYHFAHVITALLSFYKGTPVAPSANLIQGIQSTEQDTDTSMDFADTDTLKEFVKFLTKIDQILSFQYREYGVLWLGREVSLAGLFAAFGSVAHENKINRVDVMNNFISICNKYPKVLNLQRYEEARNSMDLSKINIGNVNRNAVFYAIKELINSTSPYPIDWKKHFGMSK